MDEGVDVWPPRASRSVLSQPSHTFLERERENGMGVARWVGVWLERDKKYWLIVVEILSWSLETISLFYSHTLSLSLSFSLSQISFWQWQAHTSKCAHTHTHTLSREHIILLCFHSSFNIHKTTHFSSLSLTDTLTASHSSHLSLFLSNLSPPLPHCCRLRRGSLTSYLSLLGLFWESFPCCLESF